MHRGILFTRDFLEEGITRTPDWDAVTNAEIESFEKRCRDLFSSFPPGRKVEEANTEDDLIKPLLADLGWTFSVQIKAAVKGRSDVPDVLLYEDDEAKAKADVEENRADAYRHGLAVAESKAWDTILDRRTQGQNEDRVPSSQIVRYLSRVDVLSGGRIQWGILTNGRRWRLYWQKARSVSEQYLELDIPVLAGVDGFEDIFAADEDYRRHWLKVFYLFFRKDAFIAAADGHTFLDAALEEGKRWESRVKENLSDLVFNEIFPQLVTALYENDPERPSSPDDEYLEDVRDGALTLLYRLLFILYAEDRELLPVRDSKYDDYGMRVKVRDDIANRIDDSDVFSDSRKTYFNHMRELFEAIETGDSSIGLPPYNGGLFRAGRNRVLGRTGIPDDPFALIIDQLSRIEDEGRRKWINYRDLSVQQLGSIYERLLEHEVVLEEKRPYIRPNIFARKGSGSYYTPDDLVGLIIKRTLAPLIEERRTKFEDRARTLASEKKAKGRRLADLREFDLPRAMLDLKVCDPAMGSGHFLVTLVDWLADEIIKALDEVSSAVYWADNGRPYISPVAESIENIRSQILANAKEQGWKVDENQLDDKQIVRRMILKRTIYGVDKNPMAVELAKVSLWLHTFTVGAPLSFLDHHLRIGDSLFGEWVRNVEDDLEKRGDLFINEHVQRARATAEGMQKIERLTDADIAEVKQSAAEFEDIESITQPLFHFMSFMHALTWLDIKDKAQKQALDLYFDGQFGDPVEIASGQSNPEPTGRKEVDDAFAALFDNIRTLMAEEHFLHWQVAFPGVWKNWESKEREGGFDAVIGNPPWDRIKMQEVEWFAARNPGIAHAQRAADRKKMIAALEREGDPLIDNYAKARSRAEAQANVARKGEEYPLLSGGDINLYSLFVERAQALIKPDGIAGLLTPSGIASDKTASEFFKSISTNGRLAALLDFENKKTFFPDVHASFKFCVFVAGGEKRAFDKAECAFFLHTGDDIGAKSFVLTPEDFATVNPNTGTAPVFRTPRDAEITKAIYQRLPVLVDRRTDPPAKVWPVKYFTMFHMTNDSHLFRTAASLERDGFYRVNGNRWKKGDEIYVPLYEGKMIQAYDHRAASVIVNERNLNRPAQPVPTSLKDYVDLKSFPQSQYWVIEGDVRWENRTQWALGFKDVTAPTNVRTMIAAAIPFSAVGNTLPLVIVDHENSNLVSMGSIFMLANFNAIPFDHFARQKVQGQHLNWYIVEQLPIIPPELYETNIGPKTAAEIIKDHVLRLTYTAWDMEPFARDMGYDGDPFIWDEEERRHLRARLDALYFILYGIDRDDADYILSTFPIVRKQDEKEHGRYLTRDLILAYMNSLNAGDPVARITV